jgi:hypothetical protein
LGSVCIGVLGVARMPPPISRHVYITDGARSALVRVAVWDGDDIYLMDPEDPSSGRTSIHGSGQLRLRQPGYEPPVLLRQTIPPRQVHGYVKYLQQAMSSHGLSSWLDRPSQYPPSDRRTGLIVDLRAQPPDTRFLVVEVGVRCLPTCHAETVLPFGRLGLVSDLTPNEDHLLVIGAWWRRVVWRNAPPGWPVPTGTPIAFMTDE